MISPIGSERDQKRDFWDVSGMGFAGGNLAETQGPGLPTGFLPPNEKEELLTLTNMYGRDEGYRIFKENLRVISDQQEAPGVGGPKSVNRQHSVGSQESNGSPVNYSPNHFSPVAPVDQKAYHYENDVFFGAAGGKNREPEPFYPFLDAFRDMSVSNFSKNGYGARADMSQLPPAGHEQTYHSYRVEVEHEHFYHHHQAAQHHMTQAPPTHYRGEWMQGGNSGNFDSAQIVANCHSLVQSVPDKHQLKADICRYLDSVSMNHLRLSDGVELICLIQQAFNRTEFSELCTEICHDKPVLSLVGFLHENRQMMMNEQLLKTARSLLRLTWSLTYSTIPDFLDALRPGGTGRFTIGELVLFCQCQHNYHLLKNLNPMILRTMGDTARSLLPVLQIEDYHDLNEPLYTATVIFKCFGKDFSPMQVNAVAQIFKRLIYYRVIAIGNLHKDGRSTVIHLLDACFRANVLKDHHSAEIFQEIYEHCCAEIALGDRYVSMTVQDISAVLRALQDFTSQSATFFKTLDHVAGAMLKRMQRGEAHAKDFVKNMRNLTAKCFFNEQLLENFCSLINRDLDETCHCQRPNCLKSCRALNFWSIADALDIISTPNYIYRKDMGEHINFLAKLAHRMSSDAVWDSLMKSFYDNKLQKLFFTLVGFQTYGYYPMQLINSVNFQQYIYEISRQQHGAQIARFQKWYAIKEKDYELKSYHPMSGDDPKTIFDCFFSVENAGMYPPEPIHNLQRMERKVLLALNDIKNIEIRQRHGNNRKYSHFLVNGDIAVLPISKKRFLRDGNGTIQQLARVNGRFGTYKRLLEAQYGDKLVLVPHYEFEILGNASDLPTQIQLEYVKEKLGLE